jgi:hypothetical protein
VNINIKLSDESIRNAIRQLRTVKEHLRWGIDDAVQILAKNGAIIAQDAYGSMANATDYMRDEAVGIIASTGEANLIAEFGAGDDTDPATGFENQPDTPVYPGSYSELEGSGEYARTGRWHFGGKVYYGAPDYLRVEPRKGLLQAKAYILEEGTEVAKGVIKL